MNELFRMNAHGDIWQEPELFDQPAAAAIVAPGSAVTIVAGPYVGRTGTVDWADDIVACVALDRRQPWEEVQHLTFTHDYYETTR